MRFYLGVGIRRYTPTAAVAEYMGWDPVHVRQWKCVGNFWSRLRGMDNTHLTKKVFYIVVLYSVLYTKPYMQKVSEYLKKKKTALR